MKYNTEKALEYRCKYNDGVICSAKERECWHCGFSPAVHRRRVEMVRAEREGALTLNDLRQMSGEPVWVIDLRTDDAMWCIIDTQKGSDMYDGAFYGGYECKWHAFAYYGCTWIAYRGKQNDKSTEGDLE